ncbi:DUF4365 domain-containing protein [Actinomadura decatromicini]|nr:DUF4365 domain-containing protein [Actinomadura decatromicini]
MMEQLHEGYVSSVAATAGCSYEITGKDLWGIDGQLVRPPTVATDVEQMLFVQLKATTGITPNPERATFSYQFTKRDYFDHLVKVRTYPKAILVVMAMPAKQSEWTEADHVALTTKRCCYWAHLEGLTSKAKYPSVQIPTQNIFDAHAVIGILDKIERGEPLREQ